MAGKKNVALGLTYRVTIPQRKKTNLLFGSEHIAMLDKSSKSADPRQPVVIKKYANRRLYNTESSSYVTLEDLAQMVRADRDFAVYDAKSGDDLTHAVLTQIIVEQESREGGQTLLPIPFLRQLIRYYDDSMGSMVPGYLQFSMEALTQQQEAYRENLTDAWSTNGIEAYQAQARKNLEIFEHAMTMWTPFQMTNPADGGEDAGDGTAGDTAKTDGAKGAAASKPKPSSEISALKAELAAMQDRIEKLSESQ